MKVLIAKRSPGRFPTVTANRLPFVEGVLERHQVQTVPVTFLIPARNARTCAPRALVVFIDVFIVVSPTIVPGNRRQIKIIILRLRPGLRHVIAKGVPA